MMVGQKVALEPDVSRNCWMLLANGALTLTLVGGCPPDMMDPMVGPLSADFGFTDEADDSYTSVGQGEVMPLFAGFQGGSHVFVTLRASGFPTDSAGKASIRLAQRVARAGSGVALSEFSQDVMFERNAEGVLELADRFIFLDAATPDIDETDAVMTFTLTSISNPAMTTTVTRTVRLRT